MPAKKTEEKNTYAKMLPGSRTIRISGAREHNLKNVSVKIPLGTFTCITGVSGSGKSTLLSDVFYPVVSNKLMKTDYRAGEHDSIEGIENIDKVINITTPPSKKNFCSLGGVVLRLLR